MSGVVRLQFTALKLLSLVLCLLSAGITRGDQHGGVRVFVKEGSDVVLPCSLSTKENIEPKLFDWRKVAQKDERLKEVFMYGAGLHYNNGRRGQSETFKGRVFHFPDQLKYGNASITIRDITMADSGNYTCDFPRLQPSQTFYVELIVELLMKDRSGENPASAPKPSVTILDETETWSLLQCEVRGSSLEPKVEWQDSSGNILLAGEPQVTPRGGSYDVSLQVTVTKTDRYRCVATQETIGHQIDTEIYIHISASAPKPSVTTLDASETWSLLQCEVRGVSPEPRLEWQDSSGNILPAGEPQVTPRGGSYDVILNATVTKTDRYRCVATQETINHQIYTEIYIHISEKDWSSIIGSLFGGLFLGVLTTLAVLKAAKFITTRRNKGPRLQRNDSVVQENGLVDQRNGLVDQRNGLVDKRNGSVVQENGLDVQENGLDEGPSEILLQPINVC